MYRPEGLISWSVPQFWDDLVWKPLLNALGEWEVGMVEGDNHRIGDGKVYLTALKSY